MPNTHPHPLVSIVTVNWNGLADTLECLESLGKLDYPSWNVVVVDNGSRADEAQVIQKAFPTVTVLRSAQNLGYAGGNNLGLQEAFRKNPDYVFLLNNDTVVAPDCLTHLVEALEADTTAGMAGPKTFFFDEPERIWFNGGKLSFDIPDIDHGGPAWHQPSEENDAQTAPYETEFATACALLIRGSLMQKLGGFDTRFFAYFEDGDLNLRAERHGARRLVVPAAQIWHKEARASGGATSPNVGYYFSRNVALLARKHIQDKRQAGAYYSAYMNRRLLSVLLNVRRADATDAERAQAQAVVSGLWCARLRLYGRRQDHPWVERAAAAWVRAQPWAGPLHGQLVVRPYWFFVTRVMRPLQTVLQRKRLA